MTTIARTTTPSFFEDAFGRIAAFAREYRVRRAQRIALVSLMDMDAARLDDIGLNAQDVVEALSAPTSASRVLDACRAERARTWSPLPSPPECFFALCPVANSRLRANRSR
jgi:uncharacterized protein YjiS (DUF1127 family)